MISVIIPTYNSSSTIERCLNSLINQSNKEFDVIIVDDFSEDFESLFNKIQPYNKFLRILISRNSKNLNGSASRNVGIRKSKKKYLCFLDSDDYYEENRISIAYQTIKNNVNKVDFVSYSKLKLNQKRIKPKRSIRRNELVSEYIFFHEQSMQSSTFLMPRLTAKKIMFNESLTRHQDCEFMMRAQKIGIDIFFNDNVVSNYIISQTEFISKVKKGRISLNFCNNFLINNKDLLNNRARIGYLTNISLRIALIQKSSPLKILISIIKLGGFAYLFKQILFKILIKLKY